MKFVFGKTIIVFKVQKLNTPRQRLCVKKRQSILVTKMENFTLNNLTVPFNKTSLFLPALFSGCLARIWLFPI